MDRRVGRNMAKNHGTLTAFRSRHPVARSDTIQISAIGTYTEAPYSLGLAFQPSAES